MLKFGWCVTYWKIPIFKRWQRTILNEVASYQIYQAWVCLCKLLHYRQRQQRVTAQPISGDEIKLLSPSPIRYTEQF